MTDEQREPGESFLAHRARLKAQRQRAEREAREQAAREPAAAAPAEAPPETAPRQVNEADLPPIDTLDDTSDFTQFLAEGVSDALRQAALRKLFHLPAFNVTDGLAEYDEDYTHFEKLGNVVTYQHRRMQPQEQAPELAAEAPELAAEGMPAEAPTPADGAAAQAHAGDAEDSAGPPAGGDPAEPVEAAAEPVPDAAEAQRRGAGGKSAPD